MRPAQRAMAYRHAGLADEPLANLDPDTAQRVENLLLSITDRTLLIVSHQFSAHKLHAFTQVVDM